MTILQDDKMTRGAAAPEGQATGSGAVNTHKKSPTIAAPGQSTPTNPKEGSTMSQNSISNFIPAQTPQAHEIQKVGLWIAERIGKGLNAEDMILLRDTLLSLAGQVESVEQLLADTLCAEGGTHE